MRILVTGSRYWGDRDLLWMTLNRIVPPFSTIVHGDCPSGADRLAADWVEAQPDVKVEAHPANWSLEGKGAGPMRNQRMVDLGADLCIAFPQGESRGTRDCMRRARAAGIPVVVVEP